MDSSPAATTRHALRAAIRPASVTWRAASPELTDLHAAANEFPGEYGRPIGGNMRAGSDQRLLRTVTRNPAWRRAPGRMCVNAEEEPEPLDDSVM